MIKKEAQSEQKLPTDLSLIKELIFDSVGLQMHNYMPEESSKEYAACCFKVEDRTIKFRTAKITPTQKGQFVSIWARNAEGITRPFDGSDAIDFILINCRAEKHWGLFIFPTGALIEQGIISSPQKEGKRGIRVYPPWDTATNKQAKYTQKWQNNYFLNIPTDGLIDLDFARNILFQN